MTGALAISTGSACTSGQGKPSHVLTAIGLDSADARATIRLSLGRHTHDSEIEYAADRIGLVAALRCLYRRAVADGHLDAADNPALKVDKLLMIDWWAPATVMSRKRISPM